VPQNRTGVPGVSQAKPMFLPPFLLATPQVKEERRGSAYRRRRWLFS
jgi:hypothetical protein